MADAQDANTRQQVLDLVVEKGPVTASAIARILGLTTAAVRRHITILMESGEIAEHEPGTVAKRGRGRPARHYIATERAHKHLADGYSDLAVKALRHLGQVGGEEAVDSFAAARSREIANGTFAVQLCQGHCPIQHVAGDFPQLCDAETQAFSRLLDVHVQRLATLAGGEHVCTTHIPVGMPTIRPGARAALRK